MNNAIDEINTYEHNTDIFIHTNKGFDPSLLNKNNKGTIQVLEYKTFNERPHVGGNTPWYLTWKCRPLIEKQLNDYDVFMSCDDDVLIYKTAIDYWFQNKDALIAHNYNLGFILVEKDGNNNRFWVNGHVHLQDTKIISVNKRLYLLNDHEQYCAFWIYDASEMKRWINSYFWDPDKIARFNTPERHIPEASMIGMSLEGYRGTVIPLQIKNNKLILNENCILYHQPNKYIKQLDSPFSTIQFENIISQPNIRANLVTRDAQAIFLNYVNPDGR